MQGSLGINHPSLVPNVHHQFSSLAAFIAPRSQLRPFECTDFRNRLTSILRIFLIIFVYGEGININDQPQSASQRAFYGHLRLILISFLKTLGGHLTQPSSASIRHTNTLCLISNFCISWNIRHHPGHLFSGSHSLVSMIVHTRSRIMAIIQQEFLLNIALVRDYLWF